MTPRESIDHLRHLARKAGGAGDTITMTYGVRNSSEPAVAIGLTTFAALLDCAEAGNERLRKGHNDTCGSALAEGNQSNYPCDCGHTDLTAALQRLSEAAGGAS